MNKFDKVNNVGKNAALSEQQNTQAVKKKLLNALPVKLERRFNVLKDEGKTTLNFTAFIYQAISEKLEREE